jgi:hypothetical protein
MILTKENKIKVAHLTSAHSKDDVRIFYKECSSIAKSGFEVFSCG